MIRVLIFLLVVLFLGLGFAWFADRPGEVVLQWQGNEYQTSLMVVLVGFVVLVAAIMITWWLARTILDSPQIVQRFFKARKKDRGYRALSQGLIAANSGDASSARRYTKESVRLLGREPLVDLLDAQSALLEGKREDARKRFEDMLQNDETRLVALRGLYLEAERQGAKDAARHYVEEANKSAPTLPWAANAKLRYASMEGDWEGAIKALEANKAAGLIDKETAKRQKAVLLTAYAMASEPADPVHAAKLAREAHKLAPTLVPAAVIGSKALARNSDIGRAAGMIETVWKKEPHPDLAASYVHLRIGDSAADRLKRAKKLANMKPNHPEGSFAVAEAAIDAHEWKLAREALKQVLLTRPSERACLLMSEVEEGEFGDKGRIRDWLSRAVRAPKDAAWTADGYVSDKWLPIAPLTGRIDAFEWKVPVEQLDAPKAEVLDAEGIEDLIAEPVTAPIVTEPKVAPASGKGAGTKQSDGASGNVSADNSGSSANVATGAATGSSAASTASGKASAEISKETVSEPIKSAGEDSSGAGKPANADDAIVLAQSDSVAADKAKAETTPVETSRPEGADASGKGEGEKAGAVSKPTGVNSAKAEVGETPDAEKPESKPLNGSDEADNRQAGEEKASGEKAGEEKPKSSKAEFILDRRPDDPGIRDEDLKPKPKRFGIF